MVRLKFKTGSREQLLDITKAVREFVREHKVESGVLYLWSLHTTCALTVNEGADPDVQRDIVKFMSSLVPKDAGFAHAEGNSDSHVKTSMFGNALVLPLENGDMLLGTWQHIYLAEWDGPRTREVAALVRGA